MPSQELRLPADAVLVHIGPFKTGSTAIQSSLQQHRDDLRRHGVWYPGTTIRQGGEARSLRGKAGPGKTPPGPEIWEKFADEVRRCTDHRVCISSEDLVLLPPPKIRKLVDDLGPDRVHVVWVARRLDRLTRSLWQESVKSGLSTKDFNTRVLSLFQHDLDWYGRWFWRTHGLEAVLDRWTAEVPADRITVIVADEADRSQQMRTFEGLLGLPSGLLTPGPATNESLTWNRVELYRAVNGIFKDRNWADVDWRRFVYNGVRLGLMGADRSKDELPIPPLPAAVDDQMTAASERHIAALRTSGVRVVGDPEALRYVPPDRVGGEDATSPEMVPVDAAAAAMEAVLERTFETRRRLRRELERERAGGTEASDSLEGVSSRAMLREIARRQRARLLRR